MRTDVGAANVDQLWRALVELEQLGWRAMPVSSSARRPSPHEEWEQVIAAAQDAQVALGEATDRYLHPPELSGEVSRLSGLCQEIENRAVALVEADSVTHTDELARVIRHCVARARAVAIRPGPETPPPV